MEPRYSFNFDDDSTYQPAPGSDSTTHRQRQPAPDEESVGNFLQHLTNRREHEHQPPSRQQHTQCLPTHRDSARHSHDQLSGSYQGHLGSGSLRHDSNQPEETWMDFLRDTGTSTNNTQGPGAATGVDFSEIFTAFGLNPDGTNATGLCNSALPSPLDTGGQVGALDSSHPLFPPFNSTPQPVAPSAAFPRQPLRLDPLDPRRVSLERKRRLTETAQGGREQEHSLRASLAPRPGTRPRMAEPGPTVIDLTSSPERGVRPSLRRSSGSGASGRRQRGGLGVMSPSEFPGHRRASRGGGGNVAGAGDRRQSDIMLPSWQPDSEASNCPVCGQAFTLLFRRHHCR